MIDELLIQAAVKRMDDVVLSDLRIGLGYCMVRNSQDSIGLGYILRERVPCGCSQFARAGEINGEKLSVVARYFAEQCNVVQSAVGLAAINSVAPLDEAESVEGDILDILDVQKDEWVGMVGHFAPLEQALKQKTQHLFIFKEEGCYKGAEHQVLDEVLSSCKVVIITATTLINKTFEDIMKCARNARIRALLGPSTPLYPDVFRQVGINLLSGMVVEGAERVTDIISQGGGTTHFSKYCRKVNMLLK